MKKKTRLEVSPDLTSTLIFFRNKSYYDEDEGKRKIKKKDASIRKITEQTVKSKNSVNKDVIKLKNDQIIIEDNNWYYVSEIPMKQSSIELPITLVSQMNSMFHEDLIKTYIWLYREFNYAKQDGRACLFSYKRIIEDGLNLTYNYTRVQKVKQYIAQLIWNGLIVIATRKIKTEVGNTQTFLFRLVDIKEDFSMVDLVEEKLDEMLDGANEYTGDIAALENCEFEESQVFGFTTNIIEQVSENEILLEEKPCVYIIKDKPPLEYVTIEELMNILNSKYNFNYKNIEEVFVKLECEWCRELNESYIIYERERLSGE